MKQEAGLQSYIRPVDAGDVCLLALMAFADEVPICISSSWLRFPIGFPRLGPTCLAHHTRGRLLSLERCASWFVLLVSGSCQAVCQRSGDQALPLLSTAQIVRASSLATAATTTLYGLRLSNSASQVHDLPRSDLTIE